MCPSNSTVFGVGRNIPRARKRRWDVKNPVVPPGGTLLALSPVMEPLRRNHIHWSPILTAVGLGVLLLLSHGCSRGQVVSVQMTTAGSDSPDGTPTPTSTDTNPDATPTPTATSTSPDGTP